MQEQSEQETVQPEVKNSQEAAQDSPAGHATDAMSAGCYKWKQCMFVEYIIIAATSSQLSYPLYCAPCRTRHDNALRLGLVSLPLTPALVASATWLAV